MQGPCGGGGGGFGELCAHAPLVLLVARRLTAVDAAALALACRGAAAALAGGGGGGRPPAAAAQRHHCPRLVVVASGSTKLLELLLDQDGLPYHGHAGGGALVAEHPIACHRRRRRRAALTIAKRHASSWLTGAAFSPYDGRLCVADYAARGVLAFTPGELRPLGRAASASELSSPEGVAFAAGMLFVASISSAGIVALHLPCAPAGSGVPPPARGRCAGGRARGGGGGGAATEDGSDDGSRSGSGGGGGRSNNGSSEEEDSGGGGRSPLVRQVIQLEGELVPWGLASMELGAPPDAGQRRGGAGDGPAAGRPHQEGGRKVAQRAGAAAAGGAGPGPAALLFVAADEPYHSTYYADAPQQTTGSFVAVELSRSGRMLAQRRFSNAPIKRPSGVAVDPAGHLWVTSMDALLLRLAGPRHASPGSLLQEVRLAELQQLPQPARGLLPFDVAALQPPQARPAAGPEGSAGEVAAAAEVAGGQQLLAVTMHGGPRTLGVVAVIAVNGGGGGGGAAAELVHLVSGHPALREPNMMAVQW